MLSTDEIQAACARPIAAMDAAIVALRASGDHMHAEDLTRARDAWVRAAALAMAAVDARPSKPTRPTNARRKLRAV